MKWKRRVKILDFIHLELHLVGYIVDQYPTSVIHASLLSYYDFLWNWRFIQKIQTLNLLYLPNDLVSMIAWLTRQYDGQILALVPMGIS